MSKAAAAQPRTGQPRVRAATYPPRYSIHKYWGKKPGNVVAAYIARYAEPGATVLDPFAGSGVVLCEALIARHPAIAVDLNPVASLLTRVTVEGATAEALKSAARALLADLGPLREELFGGACARCNARGEVVSTAFDGEVPLRVTFACPTCGTVEQAPGATGNGVIPSPGEYPDADIYPGWQMQKLVRGGKKRWNELFSARNLTAVAHLRRAIASEPSASGPVRRALLVSFTAHLAQSTRMIADFKGRGGGPSWKLNCYWLPSLWQELNPFRYFANRVRRTANGLADMQSALGRSVQEERDYRIWTLSAERLGERIPRASIGYVFTDPPYGGEGIQYGELSMLWNLWCGEPIALEREVAFNPRQGKDARAYAARLTECMAATYEALAPGCRASVTFANKDPSVVRALEEACRKVGFELEGEARLAPSAPNLTGMLSPAAPKVDRVFGYRKPGARVATPP